MDQKLRSLVTHCYLCPEGAAFTSPEAGTSGVAARPDDAEETAWGYMGPLEDFSVTPKRTTEEIWAAAEGTGTVMLYDVLDSKKDLAFSATATQLGPELFGLMFNAGWINKSTETFQPNAGGTTRAWIRFEQYDQEDKLVNTCYLWCHVLVDGETKLVNTVKAKVNFRKLYSAKSEGKLTVAAA
ncbi:MAG: hypothetical protein JW739_05660 [Opitutales bacterium]|nr:hypothetical protein [Opitutales bacterium]